MKYIIFLLTFSSLCAMEQEQLLKKEKINFDLKKRSEKEDCFCKISDRYKNSILQKYQEDELPLVHRVAFLPKEIQNQIFPVMLQFMFGSDEKDEKTQQAKELFCSRSIIKSLQLYSDIKQSLEHKEQNIQKDTLIINMYVMDEDKRNILLQKLNPWYGDYIDPIRFSDEKIEEDEREYFAGKKIWSVAENMRFSGPFHCAVLGCPPLGSFIAGVILVFFDPLLGKIFMAIGGGWGCITSSTLSAILYAETEKKEL